MGLFSSKQVTTVSTMVSRVIADKDIPNSVKTGAMRSLMEHDDQMIENSMDELGQSLANKAVQLFNYGRNKYDYGLPSSTLHSAKSGADLVKQAIEEDFGTVHIEYYHFGPINTLHVGWTKLIEQYGYNSLTNQLTVNGQLVWLNDMVVVVREATVAELEGGALDQWGSAPTSGATPVRAAFPLLAKATPWKADPATPNDYVEVEYTWRNAAGTMDTAKFRIPITGIDETKDYHQAKFQAANGKDQYWTYQAGDGELPAIDRLFDPSWDSAGSFFPWIYFRQNKAEMPRKDTDPIYVQNKRMCKFIGLNWDTVADAIKENKDVDNIESAMLVMAVPAVAKTQIEMRYLYDYFDSLYQVLNNGQFGLSEVMSGISGLIRHVTDSSSENGVIIIQDKKFKQAMGFRRIYKKKVTGNLGKVGTMAFETGKEVITEAGQNASIFTPVTFHAYRRQITETLYEEVKVVNLRMQYYVYENYMATADEDDDILLIPVDKAITQHYSMPKREELYARSLHYVFNSRQIQELKWYQQGWFRGVMLIVAIVITVISWGETWQLVAAALAAGATLVAAAMIIVMQLLRQLLFAFLLKLFVKIVGVKVAFIVAIVAAIAGGTMAIEAGSLNGAPWSSELLQLASGLTKPIGLELKDEFNALSKEADQFTDYIKTKAEKLKEAEDSLDHNNYLVPSIIFGETPAEFYDRTVHSGNIGVLALDAISSFVEVSLTLPKLDSSIGETTV